jgi:alkylation response protein AidB-like acyl-CoA dehydrogenase
VLDAIAIRTQVSEFLAAHDPADPDFMGARYDEGLAWVNFPEGFGGQGADRALQPVVDGAFAEAGAPPNDPRRNVIGLGMAAPTLIKHGTDDQKRRYLRPLWTAEEIWCQLFSEPGAGSDLAGLGTRAVPEGDSWILNGQKVWTSGAHFARRAIVIARTDPDVPKHAGLTYFVLDMRQPGVQVRPLRQATGEAEFNEVFLTDTRIPDADRVGEVGDGWRVAQTTLMNERVAIGGGVLPRQAGMAGVLANLWHDRPDLRTPAAHAELLRLWVQAEVARLFGVRLAQQLAAGMPGPEGSASKVIYAKFAQAATSFEMDLLGEEALRHDTWATNPELNRERFVDFFARSAGHRYLRAKGNSIEGGTTEILRNIIAERVLGLPRERRDDLDRPWKDLPK